MQLKTVRITNSSHNDAVIGDRITVANTAWTRFVGLLGRSSLQHGEGMLITPSCGIHTMGMRMPIDAISLDRRGKVLFVRANVKPWRLGCTRFKVHMVLELPAGAASKYEINLGDVLAMQQVA